MCKHLIEAESGGIKLILDSWILNHKLELDKEKLSGFLEQAHLTNLCSYVEQLPHMWFGGMKYEDENVLLLEELILNSGVYGNYSRYLDIALSRNAESGFVTHKIGNLILLLCPPLKSMQNKYPILKRYPMLLLFLVG